MISNILPKTYFGWQATISVSFYVCKKLSTPISTHHYSPVRRLIHSQVCHSFLQVTYFLCSLGLENSKRKLSLWRRAARHGRRMAVKDCSVEMQIVTMRVTETE